MKKNLTELVFIMDRSGSMQSIRSDAIGAFNAFIEDQEKLPGEANLTLVLFNDEYKEVFVSKSIKEVSRITEEDYSPAGMTALFDAVGRTIDKVGERLRELPERNRPERVAVAIMTDGYENRSTEYNQEQIAKMIKTQEDDYNWDFFFLGANIDSFATGGGMGVSAFNTMNFSATPVGVRNAMQSYSSTIADYRLGNDVDLSQHSQDDDE